ncbi:MAG: CTAG/PCC1 family protein [Candidatus Thorarchaeota archaeon]|nr:MAG: CTAG/PCC1 family protein [Candidatus Thorarchaeota archaeon]
MMTAVIRLSFDSPKSAERTYKAISPDNTPVPSGLEISAKTNNKDLVITVLCERGIDSLRATVEDLMSATDLSIRTAFTVE